MHTVAGKVDDNLVVQPANMNQGGEKWLKHDIDDHVFVNLAVTIGPGFYGGKRHDTNEEIVEVLASHATHSNGVLREVFLILEKYYRTHRSEERRGGEES